MAFTDPLDVPSISVKTPNDQPMMGVAVAGDHFVAVGPRGVITYSTPDGSWVQAKVPVQSDIVDVYFFDPKNGWACGHDGVVLRTSDGGMSWSKQLDGNTARIEFEVDYNQANSSADSAISAALQQVQTNFDSGPQLPWLGILFTDTQTGFIVGPFGNIAHSDDGGKTWQPWLEHIDNTNYLDLNAIANIDGRTYIVGEQGTVYILDKTKDDGRGHFLLRSTGYIGSLFGLTGDSKSLIVFGMRGRIFRSLDQGKTWLSIINPRESSIMGGTTLPDGTVMLVDVDGGILVSHDDGASFTVSSDSDDMPLTGIAVLGKTKVAVTGLGGIRLVSGN